MSINRSVSEHRTIKRVHSSYRKLVNTNRINREITWIKMDNKIIIMILKWKMMNTATVLQWKNMSQRYLPQRIYNWDRVVLTQSAIWINFHQYREKRETQRIWNLSWSWMMRIKSKFLMLLCTNQLRYLRKIKVWNEWYEYRLSIKYHWESYHKYISQLYLERVSRVKWFEWVSELFEKVRVKFYLLDFINKIPYLSFYFPF